MLFSCYLRSIFHQHDDAVIDLPMYLVVTIVIGSIALASILSMMILPSFFSSTPLVSVEPLISTINTSNSSIDYLVTVRSPDQYPIANAHVIIKDRNIISVNTTNSSGKAIVTVNVVIPQGLDENYFDVIVKTASYPSITLHNNLKVILRR